MFFKRFFSRRQQTTPTTEAVSRSDLGPTGMRLGHCRHSADLEELRLLAATATNAGVREVAMARYRHILAGQEASGLDLSARKEAIDRLSDHPTLDYIAKEGKEADIRLAAIGGLTDQACLAALALNDPVSSVRSAAAARLRDPEALALVARRIGKKDKNVYRLVHGRLKEMAEHESRPARVRAESEDLCNRLVGLGRFHNWSQDLALLDLIDRQWNQITEEVDETTRNRFTQERQRFLDAYKDHLHSQATEIAVVQAANASQSAREALLQELTSCLDSGDETTLRLRQAECLERWEALKGSPSDMQPQFQAAMEAIETRLQALSQERQMAEHLRVWLSEATMVLAETSPQPYPRLQGLLDRLRALSLPATLDQGLATTVNDSRAQLEERLRHEGLLDEGHPVLEHALVGDDVLAVAAHEQHGQTRPALGQARRQLLVARLLGDREHVGVGDLPHPAVRPGRHRRHRRRHRLVTARGVEARPLRGAGRHRPRALPRGARDGGQGEVRH